MVPKIARILESSKPCTFAGCTNKRKGRGLCRTHYTQWFTGKELHQITPANRTADERFQEAVNKTSSCWLWTQHLNDDGYGTFRAGGKSWLAHRWSYTQEVGPIPSGLGIDHRCHVHACVNPAHLRPATQKQNLENRAGAQSNSRTGIRGVGIARNGKFIGRVKHHGKRIIVGTFEDIRDAEQAVIAKRNELFTHNDKDRKAAA